MAADAGSRGARKTGPAAPGFLDIQSGLLELVSAAVLAVDLEGRILYANRFVEDLYGWRPDELVGQLSSEVAAVSVAPELAAEIGEAILNGGEWEGTFEVRRKDGTMLAVRVVDSPLYDAHGTVVGVVSVGVDATEAEETRAKLFEEQAVTAGMRRIGEMIGVRDVERLRQEIAEVARELTGAQAAAFLSEPARRTDGEVDVWSGDSVDGGVALVSACETARGEPLGRIAVWHESIESFAPGARRLLDLLAEQAAAALENATLFEAARRAEARQQFLAHTGETLSESLDTHERLDALGRLVVAFLADVCLVDLRDNDDLERVVAVHADTRRQRRVNRIATRLPRDAHGDQPPARVIRTNAPILATDIDDPDIRSYMSVPLWARGRTIGALTLVSCSADRIYDEGDLELAVDVARRAALMIDNGRLFEEHMHVAQVLQASLLPPSLPSIPGIELAARYVAAGTTTTVGGDFYDVFDVGYRTWAVAIGDVCGRGSDAAAITGLVRHSLRAMALGERNPARVLRSLNDLLLQDTTNDGRFCTVAFGMMRPRPFGARLTMACAGHPPPVVVRSNGDVVETECRGTLLGTLREVNFAAVDLWLHPGDAMVLFTDGVTEARRGGKMLGEDGLRETLASTTATTADGLADTVLEAVRDWAGELTDDAAVLVLRSTPA